MVGFGKRGAYFYVIDAFIASIIVVAALILIVSKYVAQPASSPSFYTAEDFLSTLESTRVFGYDDPSVRQLVTSGIVNDSTTTLLQQVVLFEIDGNVGNATGNLSAALGNRTPINVNIEIIVAGQQRYIRNLRPQHYADTLLSSKRIVLLKHNSTELYPPMIVEVRTWQ